MHALTIVTTDEQPSFVFIIEIHNLLLIIDNNCLFLLFHIDEGD